MSKLILSDDPYDEKGYEVAPGLIHKFNGRALFLISDKCASYCSFCMRKRKFVINIDESLSYLNNHPEINEILLSGGDPLFVTKDYLSKIINQIALLQKKGQIKTVRIGTRLPVHNPDLVNKWHYVLLAKIKNPYLMIHINHPKELTEKTIKVLNNFRKKSNALILSNSVLLKGINDEIETLYELFNRLTEEGIRPYCLYQNDPVPWAKQFTVPLKDAIKLWQNVRPRLSGIAATAKFIIEPVGGFGKIVVPEGGSWDVDYSNYYDFKGKKHSLKNS